MPNHCYNSLSITGDGRAIDAFMDKIQWACEKFGGNEENEGMTFTAFVPHTDNVLHGVTGHGRFVRRDGVWESTTLTEEQAAAEGLEYVYSKYMTDSSGAVFMQDEAKERGLVDWYDWNIENWGTKWDAYDVDVHRPTAEELYITFDTAWAPPVPVIQAMQEQHPELSIFASFDEYGMMIRGEIETDGTVTYLDYEEDNEWETEEEEYA